MKKAYEVNRRVIVAVTSRGGDESTCKSIAADLNLPSPVKTYYEHIDNMTNIAASSVLGSMTIAANEAKERLGSDITASFDGTWQKRGFGSRNGVTTAVTSLGKHAANKVVDTHVMSTYCNGCAQQEEDSIKLGTIVRHICDVNHDGSAGKMEVDGIVTMFKRSESRYGVRYIHHI